MKKINSNVFLGSLLVAISLIIYLFQFTQFHNPKDTFFYFLQDMAFLPMQIAIVTIVFNRLINAREKKERLKKMNMAISAFFGEVGSDLIEGLMKFNTSVDGLHKDLEVTIHWKNSDFQKAVKLIKNFDFQIDSKAGELEELKALLAHKRFFLLTLLENPNLLEHDSFSDMLWAIFHITDELYNRDSFVGLPESDLNHLSIDIKRAFSTILVEWINYVEHLKGDYPYLFSMAIRKNPFNENRSIIIR